MFAHLHVHTEYSLLDGACRIKPLIKRVKEMGFESCAITDHGVMYGVVDFYKEALEQGVHPVIGCEVYVCPDMLEKQSVAREYAHLVLLCETQAGYENLMELVSMGFTKGFYYRPRVDFAMLEKHHEGLIALSACLSGDIPKLLLDGNERGARDMASRLSRIFGKDHFYIEIQDHGIAEQRTVLPRLIQLARELELPLVATNDVHYLREQDAHAQEVLMCIQTGKTLLDENRMRMSTDQLFLKSEEQMRMLFPHLSDAIDNAGEIAKRCRVQFDFKSLHLPKFPLPEGTDAFAMLEGLCLEGLTRRYDGERRDARERLDYELSVIRSMGYVDYFLITWDFIKFARDRGVHVGPGRGSGAGSIVAYCLGITGIDPLQYDLLFERFLNPERISMPDLDIDFCYERRQEVIDYVTRKYGEDHVTQIITFGTMAARAVLRDTGRAMGMSYGEVDQVAKQVPMALDMTLEKALAQSTELAANYRQNPMVKRLIDTAQSLEGMPRHASTHAAGVLITREPVYRYVPLQTNDQVITTQFPMNTLESLGLLKMDFLGLRTLTVIGDTLDMIERCGGPRMTLETIPQDDPEVYAMIGRSDTDGVFQLEGGGMRQFLGNLKPSSFEEIIAAISLFRPGPMDSIPKFIEGKRDPSSVTYRHELLRPILDVTYGCMVYQEQVMQIVRDLAGYSLGRSDLMRRAMAKKKKDVMAKEREYFVHGLTEGDTVVVPGAVRRGVPAAVAEQIFDEMSAFASYAFNKSHAAAYAVLAVCTAYLKLHYPVQFMAALMNSFMGSEAKVAGYVQYLRKHAIAVLPPDVQNSADKFGVDRADGELAVRFGLSAVKNVGGHAVAEIVRCAREKPFRDIYDFCERIDTEIVNKRAVESLIKAGALDALPGSRAQKLAVYEQAMTGSSKTRKSMVQGQISMFMEAEEIAPPPPPLPDLGEHERHVLLAFEKEMTGIYISGHPLDEYRAQLEANEVSAQWIASLAEEEGAEARYDGREVALGGMIAESHTKATRAGGLMAFATLEDLTGSMEALIFPKTYERVSGMLTPGSLVVFSGRLSLREDEAPKLLLSNVAPLRPVDASAETPAPEHAPPPPPASGLKLYVKVKDLQQRDDVVRVLRGTPGNVPVYLYMVDEGKTYQAPRDAWVAQDASLRALNDMLGADNVVRVDKRA